mgnify:CR=1 FL=1
MRETYEDMRLRQIILAKVRPLLNEYKKEITELHKKVDQLSNAQEEK